LNHSAAVLRKGLTVESALRLHVSIALLPTEVLALSEAALAKAIL